MRTHFSVFGVSLCGDKKDENSQFNVDFDSVDCPKCIGVFKGGESKMVKIYVDASAVRESAATLKREEVNNRTKMAAMMLWQAVAYVIYLKNPDAVREGIKVAIESLNRVGANSHSGDHEILGMAQDSIQEFLSGAREVGIV